MKHRIIFRNIKLSYDTDAREALEAAIKKAHKLGLKADISDARIAKRSVDARKINAKPNFIYSIEVETATSISDGKLAASDALRVKNQVLSPEFGKEKLSARPVIVGFGPAGMFAALILAKYGYKPIVLERGDDVDKRRVAVDRFYATGVLEESNIQFGAGGAGTFSDGKLVTRVNDPLCTEVLKLMHEFGAPEEILYNAKPHVGTDKLLTVVRNIAERITALGGELLYNTCLEDISLEGDKIKKIKTSDGVERETSVLLLAPGHSARDTYEMLHLRGVTMISKPFSVGVRIEHLQKSVDESLYGSFAGDPKLPKGEYALSHRTDDRAVYTFCMCPGGEVVAAASEEGGVVTNGMSKYARDGVNANAAVAVSVSEKDFGSSPMAGVLFQRRLERAAFNAGGGQYCAPIETVGDFLDGKTSLLTEPKIILPTYMNGNTALYPIDRLLGAKISDMLKLGLGVFARKMRCFGDKNAVLTGVETRTSAPLRIPRTDEGTAIGVDNLYPCGEGAGYAGGITSAAVDGINCALKIMSRFAPLS